MDKLFDTVIRLREQGAPIKEISRRLDISVTKTKKILITVGLYENEISKKIGTLHKAGMSAPEISEELGISRSAVNSYLPYDKCMYNQTYPTKNALRIRKMRAKEQKDKEEQ